MSPLSWRNVALLAAAAGLASAAPTVELETTSKNPAQDAILNLRGMARVRFSSVPYGVQLKSCVSSNKIALTFDDGPSDLTPKVLDLLEQNGGLKATFFMVGKNGQYGISYPQYRATMSRIIASGHQIGSHSWSHQDFDTLSDDAKMAELVKNEEAFADALGFVPTYFRPPYTHCAGACLSMLGDMAYHVTDYDLDTLDWEGDIGASKSIFSGALNASPRSYVVLAHDIHPATVNDLVPFMIDLAKDKGYEFVTIGECLGDPPENWYRDPSSGGPYGNVKPPVQSTTFKTPDPTTSSTSTSSTSTSKSKSSSSSSSSTSSSTSSSSSSSSKTTTSKPTSSSSSGSSRGSTTAAPIVTGTGTGAASTPTSSNAAVPALGGGQSLVGSVLAAVAGWTLLLL